MDKGAWWATVHGVAKSWTRLSDFTSLQLRLGLEPTCQDLGSQVALVVKKPSDDTGDGRDVGSIPGSGRSPGGENGNLLQYSCLGNPMDEGA